jgi:hypothetical protein
MGGHHDNPVFSNSDNISVNVFSDTIYNNVFHINASLVLKTIDQQQSEKILVSAVDNMDGWLLTGNRQEIRFRLPQDSVERFLKCIDTIGITTDKSYSRTDLTNEYLRLIAGLQAKEYLMKQYFDILDSAGTEGIYAVSREVADLQNSIEIIKGQIRGMIERMKYAEIRIHFNFVDRRAPLVTGHSDFEWLNTVNLPSLLEDFR